jgi:ATP-dependent RNA helicase DeaD
VESSPAVRLYSKDTSVTFNDLPLNEAIRTAVEHLGFSEPTPVQEAVIPKMLEDTRDIIALAQTGTGKTAAFGLPLLERLERNPDSAGVLVLCPTRELALQITRELQAYAANMPRMRIDAVYGGAGYADQIRALKRGVDILVATPGRLLDLIEKGVADITRVGHLVLDEADIMLNMGFKEELDAILSAIPAQRQTLLISATMPPEVERIAAAYMHDPLTLTMGRKNAVAEGVEHVHFPVRVHEKYAALKRLVDYHPEMYAIIFCRTRAATQEIADRLLGEGYDVEALHGDLSQAQRELVMRKFHRRNLQLLVATDIAARGLDVEDLSHVIHFDLPDEIDIYTHRSGRTGRAGKNGTSYALVGPRELRRLPQVERFMGKKIPKGNLPGGQDIFRRRLTDFAERLAATEVNEAQLAPYASELEEQLQSLGREDLIRKIVSMQFDRMIDYYRDLPDLNTLPEQAAGKSGRRGDRSRDAKQPRGPRGKKDGSPARTGGVEEGYTSIMVNLGSKDKVSPPDLIGLVNQSSRQRGIEIGRISIRATRSFMQIEEEAARTTADALNGFTYRGRTVKAKLTDIDSGRQSHDGKRQDRQRHDGQHHGGKRKSGTLHYAHKLLDD